MPASATTFTWSNASGGDWTVPANWDQSSFPNASTAVAIIGVPGGYSVSLSGSDPAITLAALLVTDTSAGLSISTATTDTISGALDNAGRIDIDDQFGGAGGSTLTVGGTLTNSGGLFIGETSLGAPVLVTAAGLVNTGQIDVSGNATASGMLRVAGTAGFGTAGTLTGQANLNDGTIAFGSGTITTIAGNSQLQLFGAAQISNGGSAFNSALAGLNSNQGELSIEDDSLAVTGDFTNSNRIDIDDQFGGAGGSTLSVSGTLTNSGNLFFGETSLAADDLLTAAALVNTGQINLADASGTLTATLRDSGTAIDSGNINIATNATLAATGGFTQSAGATQVDGVLSGVSVTLTGGILDGNGTIAGPLDITGGEVFGGDQIGQPGTLTVTGAYTQGANGVLIADLAGTGAGQASEIVATGGASLGGTLDINTVNGFSLANGDTFTALTFAPGQLAGAFSALEYNGQVSTGAINIGNNLFMLALYNEATGNVEIEVTNTTTAFTWTNSGSGGWTDPANWTSTAIPGAGDAVVVPNLPASATVSLNGSDSIVSLDFEGGGALSVGSGDTLTMTSAISLPGTIMGGGVVEIQNQLTNTASIAIQDGTLRLDAGVTGGGTLATAADGTILLPNGATIAQIEALEAANQGTIAVNGTFSDAGQTLRVTSGTVEFQNTLTNTGSIVIDAGTLKLDAGLAGSSQITLLNGGVLDAGGGTLLLEIGNGNTYTNGGVLEASGGGSLRIDGGTLANQGGTLFANGGDIKLSGSVLVLGGTLSSADGGVIHSISGNTATLDPVALPSLVNTGVYSVDNGSTTVLVGAVSNQGTILDDGSLQIGDAAGDGAALTNQAGGLIELQQNGVNITQAAAGTNIFTNDGTLAQVGSGNDYVEMPLVNNGLVTSENGFLELRGGVLGGTIAGQVGLIGTYTAAANTTDTVTFAGATLGWNSDGAAVLAGPGTLVSNGYVGVYQYYGYTQLQLIDGITWENAGTVNQNGAILFGGGTLDSATIVNQAGALYELTSGNSQLAANAPGNYNFVNAGTLEMIGGGSNTVSETLANSGLVSANNGALYLSGPVSNSGTLQSDGGFLEVQGGTLGGTIQALSNSVGLIGTYTVAANTADTVTFANANLGWYSDGTAVVSGPGTLVSDGNVHVSEYYGYTQLQLAGGVTWNNAGTVYQDGAVLLGGGTLDSATIVNQAGAVYDLTSGNSQIDASGAGNYNFVNAGTLEMTGGGSDYIYGTLANSGLISANNGNLYLPGPVSNSGTLQSDGGFLEVRGGTLGGTIQDLAGSVGLIGTYTVAADTTDTVTLADASLGWYSDGIAVVSGPGTLVSNGYVHVSEYYGYTQLQLAGGVTWDNTGTVYQDGAVLAGSGTLDSATIVNQAGAVYDLTTNNSNLNVSGAGSYTFVNDGLLEMTGGGSDTVSLALDNSGLITADNGGLDLAGPIVNSGTIETAGGSVQLNGGVLGGTIDGQNGNAVLVGTYVSAANTTVSVTFGGAYLGSGGAPVAILAGPGTLATSGYVDVNEYYAYAQVELTGGITWTNIGSVNDYGGMQFGTIAGDSATFVNQAGAIFDLTTGNANLSIGAAGNYGFVNAGTLEMTGGGGDAIAVPLTNTGLVSADNGTLSLNGPITNSGTIQAAGGSVQIDGGVLGGSILGGSILLLGTYVSAANTTDTVTFSGAGFGSGGNFAVLAGPGTLATNGSFTVNQYYNVTDLALTGGITWDNAGFVNANGAFQFGTVAGDSATLNNLAGGVIDLTSGDSEIYVSGTGTYNVFNAGTLEMTGGGSDNVDVALSNSGLVLADNGTLLLNGPIANTGTIQTAGGAVQLDGGVLGGAILGGNILLLGTYVSAAGTTDSVTFSGAGFGSGGNFAVLAGPGTLATNGSFSVNQYYNVTDLALTGGITWDNAGDMTVNGAFQFGTIAGDSATLVNQAAGIVNLTSGYTQIYAAGSGTYSLVNAGLLEMTGGGTDAIDVAIDDTATGTITAANGDLVFNAGGIISGAVNGSAGVSFNGGNVTVTAGGDITAGSVAFNAGLVAMQGGTVASAGLSIAGGVEVTGYGAIGDLTSNGLIDAAGGLLTVNGNVTGSGSLQIETGATLELTGATSQNVTFDGIDATLRLDPGSNFTGALQDFGAGDTIDLGGVTLSAASVGSNELIGTLAAGGTIAVSAPGIDAGLQLVLGADANGASTISLLPSPVSAVPGITSSLGPNNAIALPEVHVGASDQATLSIANTATAPADGLTVSIGSTTGDADATGSITSLAPGDTSINIAAGVDSGTAGARSGTVSLNFESDGSVSGVVASLGSQTLNVSGSVYRYAAPSVTAPSGVILHVGDGGGTATEALTVANTDPADGYSEGLDAVAAGVASGNLTGVFGNAVDIGAGGGSALQVTFSTATAGTVSGSVDVALTSDGTGVDTLGLTPLDSPAAAYSAVGAFSTASNANGVWSYLAGGTLLSTASTGSNFAEWSNGGSVPNAASVTENTTSTTQTYSGTVVLPPTELNLDPENVANVAVQFTAPTAGIYTFTGAAVGTDTNEQGHAIAVVVNGNTVATGTISLYGQSVAIGLTETLAAGGTVDFVSDTGGSFSNLSTGLSLEVTSGGGAVVPVSATIDNYATAAIQQVSGPGTLAVAGNTYTIDLGTVAAAPGDIVEALAVANTAEGPADWLSGSLSASGSSAFGDTGVGAFGTLGAGGTTPLSIDLSTANAGVFSQTITLAATDSNAAGFNEALAGETIVVTGTVLSTAQLAQATINEPAPIVLPDVHVVSLVENDQTTLSISNTGSAVLSGAVASSTGNAYGSGAFTGLAVGATDTTAIIAGLNNTSAGAKSGSVTLNFNSGSAPSVPLASQTVTLTGDVYREAAPSIAAPPNLYVHVGDGGGTDTTALIAANTDPADGFSESLDTTMVGIVSGGLTSATGTVNGIAAGATNTTGLTLGFSTATATTINATVAVAETSDGTGIDSLGTVNLGTVDVPVAITVDNYATAAIEQQSGPGPLAQSGTVYTLNLGTFSAGQDPITADFALLNTASGPADTLSGSLQIGAGSTAFSNTGLGSFTGGTPFDVTLATGSVGAFRETIVFAGTAGNPSGFSQVLPGETLVVTGAIDSPAVPVINTASPIDFGNVRQNATAQQAVSITNAASAGSAFLDVYTAGATGAGMDGGVILLLAPGATDDSSMLAELDTSQAGVQTGQVYFNVQSDTGPGGSANYLEGPSLTVQGTIYREATPSLASAGIVYLHAGESGGAQLVVQNTAEADGFSENLLASVTGVTGALAGGSGSVSVAAGGSNATALSVAINAGTTTGVFTGDAVVDTQTDGTGVDGLGTVDLGTVDVPVTYDVNNFATAELAQTGGYGVMTPSGIANTYTLNLGATEQGAAALSASLEALNAAQGPAADLLNGTFTVSGDSEYVNNGFAAFNGVTFGTADTNPDVTLDTNTIGTFTEQVVLTPTGSNPSGYSGILVNETIDVVGTIVTQPPPAPPPLPTAIAWGDVHLTTFDGLYYNFQAEGEFVLAQSTVAGDSFQVQARMQPYGANSTVSVITMLAAEVGTDRVTFGIGRTDPVSINGTAVAFGAVGETMSLGAGGSITEVSAGSYQVNWATGEVMDVTMAGTYINTSLTLSAADGPGSVEGLLGGDTGQANDFQLADGTVLAQPLDASTLYGAFANAWRVTGGSSLMDYLAGQNTGTFTDTNFPADSVNIDSLPAAILQVAEQEVIAAGITDPNQQAAAIIDLLVTGDPNTLLNDANINQTGVITDAAVINSPPPPVPALGVSAAATNVVETAGGTTTVTFTAYLTSVAGTDTVIDYAVTAPNATYLGASAFGGTLPSGFVVIAAGQTTANFTVTLPTAVLGSTPSSNLQVSISSTNGDPVFGPSAQTEIDNYVPVAGNPAIPLVNLLSGTGVFGGSNGNYTLNLGTLVAGESPLQAHLQIANEALAPSDFLTGSIVGSGSAGFTVYGTGDLNPLSAGSSFQGLAIQTNSGQVGPQSETIVFSPVDDNVTGYSAILPSETVTITDTVLPNAVGTLETSGPINLGTFYEGQIASTALVIGNTATAGSAGLDVSASVASGSATAGGAISDLAPGTTNNSGIVVGIDTSSPGVKTGEVTLNYASDAGSGNTASDGSTVVQVTGTVYGPATAYLAAEPIYVHQGDDGGSVTVPITISNTAPDNGYAENLNARVVNFGTYVTAASGSVFRLAPGLTNNTSLTATLSDAQLGSYSGEVQVALLSDGTGIDSEGTTTLGSAYVQATVDVDQYAVAAIEEISGNGTLTPTGVASQYVLNLGTVAQYAAPLGANLGALNDVLGQADLLAGSFSITGAPEFVNVGFGAFGSGTEIGGLAAQQVDSHPVVVLSSGTVGTFTETVTLTPTDYNPGGYSAVLAPETVTITGTVVAAPPPVPVNRVANAWGDVHLTTFDGLYYNFQAAGEFVLSESTIAGDTFQVQARMQPLGSSSVTLNTEIAAQIGNDRVTFEAGRAHTVYIDGVAASLTSLNEVVSLAGGALEENSANSYTLIWNTGEQLQVTNEGSYLNATISLPNSDAGNVQGLLGPDDGNPADDLQLPGGTDLGTTVTYAELYGQYADAWRVTDTSSLMDYDPGQDTASFTNTNFPYNQISLGNLPAGAVAQAEAAAAAAGITDPNLVLAAVEDYLLTGNPDALIGSENVQQQEGTTGSTGAALTAPPPVVAAVGVFANLPSVVESTSGAEAVGFTVSLTSAEANATTIDYQVVDSGPGFLTAADFGGILPSGTVTIAAGQTSALFTVALPANVLGAAADENLQVVISSTGGETVFAPLAQTEILATGPTEGNPAAPLVEQLSGDGTLSANSGTSYVLNLGTVAQYSNPLVAGLGVLNNGVVPADLLSGSFVVSGSTLYENGGLAPFSPLAAGAADTAPDLELLTGQIGTFTETITLSPTDSNLTGFSASLAPVTVVVTGTVTAPPPPPPPPVPVATAWGDVHLTTFDGLYYNFQAAGEFVLTRSTVAGDTFQVQTRLQPYAPGSSVSVQTQIGAEIGTDDVTFGVGTTDAGVYLDGTAYSFNSSGVMTLSGGSVTEISAGNYRVNWNTGESMTVSLAGAYINDTISLTAADAGNVEGLLGPDNGNQADDLQLANGTPLGTTVTSTELYGAYANAWRITGGTSLLNYGAGQTTATFTDTSFPSDALQLDQLPASVVAAAEQIVEQQGITDPNLIQAAVIDLLVTGDPNAVAASANVQQSGVSLFGVGVSNPPPLPDVGIVADNATAVETTTGTVAVGYTVYLTAAEAQATTITYQVTDPGAGYLGLSGIVGGTGSGSVQLAAGQTSAQITIDVLANALGSLPNSNLQVTVTPTGGEAVVGATAQTEIVNPAPTAGSPAVALVEQLSGNGTLTGSGTSYDLNLGTAQQNASRLYANLGIENGAVVPADNLSGLFGITNFANFLNTGFDPFSNVAPGTADTEPVISLNTGTIGVFTETVVLDPTDTNASGYSAVQNDVTVTVTGTIVAPPPPPPPPEPTAIAWGDVHLTTFDGLYYNFQAVGEFTLAKSTVAGDSYDVQIRTEPYSAGSSVSVIDQIAAALGNQSVTFGLNRSDMVYLNGTAQAMGVGSVLTINGDTVRELSSTDYVVTWSTGETLNVTSGGNYLNVSTALSSTDGPGSVQGLLGSDSGIDTDFEPVVSGTTITTGQLYGSFADTWRVSQVTSLLNYAAGQTTNTFTDLAFPSDAETLADLPAALLHEGLQAAIQAGITDPNLQQAAALDFIVTGNPGIVVGGQNVQQQGITTTTANVAGATLTTAVGVSANNAALVEPATGNLSVGFTVYLTAAEAQATTIDYTVAAPGAGYLDASAFGGTLPSGSVTIAAGQTSASFSVSVAAGVLGTLPSSALQVTVAPEDGEAVFAPDAQTTIVNNAVEPGTPADPIFALLSGAGTLTQAGNAYTLNLGSFAAGTTVEALSLTLENIAGAGGNALAGMLSATSTPGFTVSGTGPLPAISAGSQYEDLHISVNTAVAGTNTETITLTPLNQNASGYSGTLTPITLTVTDMVTQQTFNLTRTPTTISGGTGGDSIVAVNNVLYSGDTIAPGGSSNTLLLEGPGTFDLRAPATLSNIQTADVEDASAGQSQTIYLRNGLNLALNVLDSAGIAVVGAANNDIINLGSGAATVYLGGAGETVNGGTGNETFVVTAATIGATIAGGSGTNLLKVQNGGTGTMGSNVTGMQTVLLDNSASYDFTANTTAGLLIHAGTGNDTIAIGAASQAVFGSTGTLTVLTAAAQAGAAVYGNTGGATTLEITTGGTVTLNHGDTHLTVQLAAADTMMLPFNTSIAVRGGGGDDTLIATSGVLRAGQTIAPGGGTNTLLLEGAGLFNLSTPAVVSNIQTVDVEDASAGQSQVVWLRSGLDLALNVLDTAGITVFGAANNDIINLGSGNAVVYLGLGETVNGGAGNATFFVTSDTAGQSIAGGSGKNLLEVQGGGTVTMGAGITGMSQTFLDNSASYDFTANTTAGLLIHAGAGDDAVAVAAASQGVFASTGTLTVMATAADSAAAVYGNTSSTTTLEITTGGTVTLNHGDTHLTVQLAAADTMMLPFNTSIAVRGGGCDDTLVVTDGVLRAGQTIAPGGGTNTLLLEGAGLFNLGSPAVLSNIQTVDVEDASAGQGQVVWLRSGLDLALNVQDTADVTIFGAANNDTINLGAGNANVYVDVGETVNGGTGNGTFFIAAISNSPTITGGSGTNVLHVLEGGTVVMDANITGMSQVFLDNAASYDFTANATAHLSLFAGTGNDTITVGSASQKVVGSTGPLTVKATAAEAGILVNSGTGGTTLELTTGGTAALNASDTNLTVKLDATTNLGLGKLGFMTVNGGTTSGDTITGGGANDTVTVGGGANHITMTGASTTITTGNGNNTIVASGLGDQITSGSGNDTITDMVGSATIRAGLGTNTIMFAGSGNEIINQGGTDTLTDTGTDNTFVVPLAGQGLDTINGSVLANGDTFDLRNALAATTWDQQLSDLGSYLKIATEGSNALVQISTVSGGTPITVAILNGAAPVSLSTFVPHALLT